MNNLYEYLSCKTVIDKYYSSIDKLFRKSEYQHFLTRLKLVKDIDLPDDTFCSVIDDIRFLLDNDKDTYWKIALENDKNGYLTAINDLIAVGTIDADTIKFYFYITQLTNDICILKRNNVTDVNETIDNTLAVIDDFVIDKMITVSKNEYLRKYEGTVCVNGIGYLFELCEILKKKEQQDKLGHALRDLFIYYLEHTPNTDDRNFIYGLTHCIINITHFYTQPPYTYVMFNELLDIAKERLHTLLENNKKYLFADVCSDMLAEMALCYKILCHGGIDDLCGCAIKILTARIDRSKGYICEHPSIDFTYELERNEHTNILYILCNLLELTPRAIKL